MLTKRKRTIVLFVVSVIMNLAFFLLSHYLKLPFWLDTSGTIYITVLLNFPAGFLAGLINNVILSLFFYGFNSMSYYVISAGVAFASGMCVRIRKRRNKELNWVFAFYLAVAVFAVSIMLAVPISLCVDSGVPSDYWGSRLYFSLLENHVGAIISTVVSTSLIKLSDVVVTIAIVMSAYSVTPIRYKHEKHLIY